MSEPRLTEIFEQSQESLTGFQTMISSDHNYIHQKKGFSISTNTGSLASAATYKFAFTTPAASTGKYVHLRPVSFSSSANLMLLQIHEETDFTGGTILSADNHFREADPEVADSVFKYGVTAALTGRNIIASTAGGNFGNQPNNDGVEIVSDNAADVGMVVTLYGTLHGATTVVISENITLTGTTQAVSTHTNWSAILGVEMDAEAAGTVTIREASDNLAITSLSTGTLSAGVATITDSRARDRILRIDANGASTKIVGVIGTAPDGTVLGVAAALDGTTEKDLSASIFRTVTKVLIGDVESARECWVLRPEVIIYQDSAGQGSTSGGRSGGASNGAENEFVLEPATDYIINITNAGPTTASTAYLNLFFYEEA